MPSSFLSGPTSHRARGHARTTSLPVLRHVSAFLDWGRTGRRSALVVRALAGGLLIGCMVAAVTTRQWVHVHGWPVEHARIMIATPTGDSERCGKHSFADVYELTWASEDSPPGLPPTFTDSEGCSAGTVGDSAVIVRVIEGDGSVHVWDDPATSLAEVAVDTGVGLVLGAILGVVVGLLQLGGRALRRRWSSRHVASPG